MVSRLVLTGIMGVLLGVAALPASANAGGEPDPDRQAVPAIGKETRAWRFRVWLGKKEIGFHEFRVHRSAGGEQVEIDARFDVRFLFINAYRYRHENVESWQGQCLAGIEAETEDGGERYEVRGRSAGNRFTVEAGERRRTLEADCIRSFAYWNPAFLDSTRLLNAQTGDYVEVRIMRGQQEMLQINGQQVAADRYALELDEGTISLWYARANGQWVALEAPAPGGRVLRYEPISLPFELPAAERLAMQ